MKLNRIVIAVIFVLCALAACKKGYDTIGTKLYTSVNFINATPDTVNLYVNGSRVNTTNALYPLGSSGYLNPLFGEQNYQVRKAGKPDVLFSLPVSLDTGKVYSFFIAGNTAEQTFVDIDTLSTAAKDTTLMRFVNTSPTAGKVDLLIADSVIFENKDFKSISDFVPIGAGLKHIRIYKSGVPHDDNTTLLIDESRIITSGNAYTFFIKSSLKGTGLQKNSIGLTTNNRQ